MRIWYLKVTRFISVCLCFSRTCVNVVSRCERMNLGRLFWRIIHSTQSSLLLLKIAKEVLAKLGWAISRLLVRRPRERASEWLVGLAVQRNVCGLDSNGCTFAMCWPPLLPPNDETERWSEPPIFVRPSWPWPRPPCLGCAGLPRRPAPVAFTRCT